MTNVLFNQSNKWSERSEIPKVIVHFNKNNEVIVNGE